MSVFEDHCFHCNVSVPPGTRRCIHCGGRVGHLDDPEPLVAPSAVEEAEESGRSGMLRVGLGAMWFLLAIVGSVMRVCSE
ncbi:MAG: hypothetical protein MJE66_20495 [Proteobacteria bacterium]|nr:hypothetical protein [Pseudomonadota bacterium]